MTNSLCNYVIGLYIFVIMLQCGLGLNMDPFVIMYQQLSFAQISENIFTFYLF